MNSSSLIHINLLDCHSAVYFRTLITVLFLIIDQNISMAKTNINGKIKLCSIYLQLGTNLLQTSDLLDIQKI